ncbi:MAG: flagellar biosynthetic protein FliO [Bacteroidetes bacterium]|nr:flagellar biosynthetic protein FliO [Bacteroidota bacterium]MBU1116617.1 flagellar biosynthetic protein FliO [Bacteroidota bacterium]MBU1797734.1 flagellar biosynthetic protein FliO [Bacteroidota bacterium]
MGIWDVLTAILPLILIVGLLYATLIFVRKSGFTVGKSQNKMSKIKVISSQAIMNKKFISIVKVQNSYLVLGIAENSITLLKELDSIDEDIDENEVKEKLKFSEVLKQNLGMK